MTRVLIFVRRAIKGSPRRSAAVAAIAALVVGITVAQVQVASGLRSSVRGALSDTSRRIVVLAVPTVAVGPVTAEMATDAGDRLRSLAGVVAAGSAARFVDSVGTEERSAEALVGWAEPTYLWLVVPGPPTWRATFVDGVVFVPTAVRDQLAVTSGSVLTVGGASAADLGDPPPSFVDPGLKDAVLTSFGRVGPGARFGDGSLLAAVLFDREPDDAQVAGVVRALAPDRPDAVVVVSRGEAPERGRRIEALAGSSGRTAVVVVAVAGVLILVALQLIMVQRRRGEIAVRMALGGTRGDVAGLLLVEAGLLGTLGSALGVVVANGALVLLATSSDSSIVPVAPVASCVAVGCGAAVTVLATAPLVWSAARRDPADVLRSLGEG